MGSCTANARLLTVDIRCRGTTINCCVADLRRCLLTTSVTGVQQSARYCGAALPCRHLCICKPSAGGQPTRSTRPFILSAAIRCSPPQSVQALSGERLRGRGSHDVLCGLNCVIHGFRVGGSTSEGFERLS